MERERGRERESQTDRQTDRQRTINIQSLPTCVISEVDDPYSENCPVTIRCFSSHSGIRVKNPKTPRPCPRMLVFS